MKKLIFLYISLICFMTTGIIEAQAQSHTHTKNQRIDALEEKIDQLTKELDDIKSEELTNIKTSMKPSPKFTNGSFSFQPFGRIHLDYAFFDDDVADHPDGAEFRRARMGMKGNLSEDFGYKFEIDFANENSNFRDVFLNYTGVEGTEFRVGSFKIFTGLDNLTSSNSITFIERAAATSAFTTGHIIGAGAIIHRKNWSLSGGVFNDDAGLESDDDEALALNMRGTFAPINQEGQIVHLGASVRYQKPDQSNDRFDFDSRAENSLQSMDSVEARFSGDNATIYGLEAGMSFGPLHAQAEYFFADVSRDNNLPSVNFDGGYIEAGYFLTGEHRSYKSKQGTLSSISPNQPLDPKNGHWGAWQIAGRYSMIDVTDQDILGGEMDNYTIGLNWYPNKYTRFMANYILVDTNNNAVTPNDDPSILLLRSQVAF